MVIKKVTSVNDTPFSAFAAKCVTSFVKWEAKALTYSLYFHLFVGSILERTFLKS